MTEYLSGKQKRVHWNVPYKSSEQLVRSTSPNLSFYQP